MRPSEFGPEERPTVKLVSVNVGLPREVIRKGKTVTTGFFKAPVAGRVMMRTLNLDGDRQGDLEPISKPHVARVGNGWDRGLEIGS